MKRNEKESKEVQRQSKDELIRELLGRARDYGLLGIQAEFCARYIAEKFPDEHPSYWDTWFYRFKYGTEFQYASDQKALLKIMCESWMGTARHIKFSTVKEFVEEYEEYFAKKDKGVE